VLECVVNVSEGRRADVVAALAAAASGLGALLDVHTDPDHNRSVLTLAGPLVEDAARAVTALAVDLIDLRSHDGVHPRIGVVDVVPFVPLAGSTMADAVAARDAFAAWCASELGVPCVLYGAGGPSLPEVRRAAAGSARHERAGAVAVGARDVLVAYNVWLAPGAGVDVEVARRIAASLRGPAVRALGLALSSGGAAQVSCNLIDPSAVGPDAVYDAVAAQAPVARAELVGLLPAAVLDAIPERRWAQLDVSWEQTIEARLRKAGLDGGSFDGAVSGRGH
jgi:glutamate formiminotransferase